MCNDFVLMCIRPLWERRADIKWPLRHPQWTIVLPKTYRKHFTVVSPRADTGIGPYAVQMGERFAGGSDVFKGSTEVATVKMVILKGSTAVGGRKMAVLSKTTVVVRQKMTIFNSRTV